MPTKRRKGNTATQGFTTRSAVLAGLILAAACLVVLAGCGKKDWPSPRTEKDRFSWASVQASRDGSCLVIRGELEGAVQNLKEVFVRLETSEELCPGCPFTPTSIAAYSLSDPSLRREGNRVTITHCPVDPNSALRLRLEGVNVFQQIRAAPSDIVELEAQNATRSEPYGDWLIPDVGYRISDVGVRASCSWTDKVSPEPGTGNAEPRIPHIEL